jgi:hypothetical protein
LDSLPVKSTKPASLDLAASTSTANLAGTHANTAGTADLGTTADLPGTAALPAKLCCTYSSLQAGRSTRDPEPSTASSPAESTSSTSASTEPLEHLRWQWNLRDRRLSALCHARQCRWLLLLLLLLLLWFLLLLLLLLLLDLDRSGASEDAWWNSFLAPADSAGFGLNGRVFAEFPRLLLLGLGTDFLCVTFTLPCDPQSQVSIGQLQNGSFQMQVFQFLGKDLELIRIVQRLLRFVTKVAGSEGLAVHVFHVFLNRGYDPGLHQGMDLYAPLL